MVYGCSSILGTEEREVVVVGVVEGFATESAGIEVPETVQADEDFAVTIYTVWPDGCARKDKTVVEVDGARATITPYDVVTEHGTCTQVPQRLSHTATLRFAEPGIARITVEGRSARSESVGTVQRNVTVQ